MKLRYTIDESRFWIVLIISIITIHGCDDYLNIIPKNVISEESLWVSKENADLFLNDIYSRIPSYANVGDVLENYSDNAVNGIARDYSGTVYRLSSYTPSNGPSKWGHFSDIRKCNLFIEKVLESSLPDDWKKLRIAETRFLRSYFYSLLALHHGGVPIITEALDRHIQGDDIFRSRNSFQEVIDFISKECKESAVDLPLKASESGRITKGAALMLKAWCELFNASPLYNVSGEKSKWEQAANSFEEIMNLDVYQLFPDYRTLFFEENNGNSEVIFARMHVAGVSGLANMRATTNGVTFTQGVARAFAGSNPTQELINAYQMSNGLPIDDPDSGYDPQNPYDDRESRFYADIVYDGSEWLGFEVVMKSGVGSKNETDIGDNNEASNTGYYWKKGIDPAKQTSLNNLDNGANCIIFRYAEVLLGYAEARNEAVGPDEKVYAAVNQIRERVGLPILRENLRQEEMREVIRKERRVELAGEDKRWYDIIRWKIAEEVLNSDLHAVTIVQEEGKWVYKYVVPANGKRIFYPEKNYVYPIPQSAIDANPKLIQNPNYE